MATKKKQNLIQSFLLSTKQYPVLIAIASGLYPLLYYFTRNFHFVNSAGHLAYFSFVFLLVPIILFVVSNKLSKMQRMYKWKKYILPFLNFFFFLFFIMICRYAGINKKITLLIFPIALIASFFLHKFLKKIVIIQLILAVIGLFTFANTFINKPVYSSEWLQQPDDISKVVFKTKPNIYLIQPDGYVNFSELKKGYYQLDTNDLEDYLVKNGFTNYPDFRSNYSSTLSSNSALFAMKHHYYNGAVDPDEGLNAGEVFVSEITVLEVFKSNGYKTHLVLEAPYIMINKPTIGYDESNIKQNEIPYIGNGFANKRDVINDLKSYLELDEEKPSFFFIEYFFPGHINNRKSNSRGKEVEKEKWIENLDLANSKLIEMIDEIKKHDTNGIIIILSDHGGYVCFDYSMQIYTKKIDRDLIFSIFGSNLSIYWPENLYPKQNDKLKSTVNVFRFLFSNLSNEERYLQNLEKDESYMVIFEGAPKGIYKYIDENKEVTFEKK
jgi:hypothetical protein